MSGTSLDGVDAVLVDCANNQVQGIASHYQPFDESYRQAVLGLQFAGHNELERAMDLANLLASHYAEAVLALLANADIHASQIAAIGCHGQTVRHAPERGWTVQLNHPARLAELTGICVIADFRSRDIAAGGQGAPLVPAFHDAIFRSATSHRVILNIGGIANLTNLAPDIDTSGFDCGPGNMLLDAWIQEHRGMTYDVDGQWASQGHVLPEILDRLLSLPYLSMPPPKSCGREQFNLAWLRSQLSGNEDAADVQATLVEFTAASIADNVDCFCGAPEELFVCGGGANNPLHMAALAKRLPACRVSTTQALGVPVNHVEAMAFAWLAQRTLQGQPGNLPRVTGARGLRILGAIYPA